LATGPAGLLAAGERYRRPGLRLHGAKGAPAAVDLADGRWAEVVRLHVDEATARALRLPAAMDVRLEVSGAWLDELAPWPQERTHRVDLRPAAGGGSTRAEVLGAEAGVDVVQYLPSAADLRRLGVAVGTDEGMEYDDANAGLVVGAGDHRFLGHADTLQGDVWDDAADQLDRSGERDLLDLLRQVDHRLLFQVDSDWDLDFLIADVGRLHVLVPCADLAAMRADRTVATVQTS
jgi:hypothetical protein